MNLLNKVWKQLLLAPLFLWGIVTLLFIIFSLSQDDPAKLLAGQRGDIKTVEAIRKELGLDQPLLTQYFRYLNDLSPIAILKIDSTTNRDYTFYGLVCLDKIEDKQLVVKLPYLRKSFQNNRKVTELYFEKFPATIFLTIAGLSFGIITGIGAGVIGCIYPRKWIDRLFTIGSLIGISSPSFFVAVILIHVFAVFLHDLTGLNASGYMVRDSIWTNEIHLDLSYIILPAFTLGIRPLSVFYQLTKDSLKEVMVADYIRTAKAKGLSKFQVVFGHALRNALNPVIGSIVSWFGSLLTGAFFVEYIFNWEGVGKLTVDALSTKDQPLLIGCCIFTAVIFYFSNILSDVLYLMLDPRIEI